MGSHSKTSFTLISEVLPKFGYSVAWKSFPFLERIKIDEKPKEIVKIGSF